MTAVADVRDARMPVTAHLREVRTRLLRAAIALAITTVVGFVVADPVLDLLRAPILELAQSRDATLNYDTVTGAFDLKLKIAMFAGIVLSSPVWLLEVFAFVAPGLHKREKRYAIGFLSSALPLFLVGCAAGLWMFPHMVELLASFAATEDSTVLLAADYVDFVGKIVAATGIAFTLPVFVVLLNFIGMLPATTIVRTWRFNLVGIVVFSAMVTPSADVLSMFLIAVPMTALFAGAALIAGLHDRRIARRNAALAAPVDQAPRAFAENGAS